MEVESEPPAISAFHLTAAAGGPIHEGLPVAITYHDHDILRLEVQGEVPPLPSSGPPPAMLLVPALLIVGFPLIGILIAAIGGWRKLAQAYPAPAGAWEGEIFGFQSVMFGPLASYNNCIDVAVSPTGITLQPVLLFRAGQAPIHLPWSAVRECRNEKLFLRASTVLTVSGREGSMRFFGGAAERMREAWAVRAQASAS